jgi:acyl-CoA-binding protein
MTLAERFTAAQAKAKAFKRAPTNDQLLDLYALYKQGTAGDASGARPGMFDLVGRAKFDAWAKQKGTTKDAAMESYCTLVDKLALTCA